MPTPFWDDTARARSPARSISLAGVVAPPLGRELALDEGVILLAVGSDAVVAVRAAG